MVAVHRTATAKTSRDWHRSRRDVPPVAGKDTDADGLAKRGMKVRLLITRYSFTADALQNFGQKLDHAPS